ncbi:MAG: S41 family peptidase, partial [Bacteroidaceae bacterium]
IAYLENRSTIKVMNLKSRAVRTIMEGKYEYSYIDGDQWYQWSPDSKWILTEYIGIGGWNNSDVALFNADGKGKMYNLTESGYSDTDPKWVLDGKAMIWSSDRAGYRNHGSWGAEQDVYITFFDSDAYDKFLMSKEDLARLDAIEKDKKDKGKDKKSKNDKSDKSKDSDEDSIKVVEPLKFDITNHRDRVVRLTVNSSFLGDYVLTPKGDKLYYLATFEKDADLWVHDFKKDNTHIVLKNVGDGHLIMDKKGNNIFICTHGAIKKIDLSKKDNAAAAKNIDFEADLDYRPYKERAYMFDHIWRQMKDKFYRVDMNGVNWKSYRKIYEKFLPYINNNYDFTEMLSEMLGELNASHTGARYYPSNKGLLTTAALGVFYDDSYQGDGLRIKEILDKGPFTLTPNKVKVGCIINKIDGQEIKKGEDYFPLFEGKVGKKVLLSVYNPSTKQYLEATVKAISYSAQVDLLYKRWVDRRRATVDSLSGGKIGYVHIKSMDSQSFRTMYSELLGRCRNKEAMIVDERHNGGGWLHDDVATLLSGKEYVKYVPRGQFIGSDPYNKWVKPSCMLICEDDYSNAHGTPWVYKTLGVGKLIGSPVPGTMTAVWWESQIDKSVVFGIPEVGCIDNSGHYLENTELEPDILIYNDPASVLKGEDKQLEKAVKVMMKK